MPCSLAIRISIFIAGSSDGLDFIHGRHNGHCQNNSFCVHFNVVFNDFDHHPHGRGIGVKINMAADRGQAQFNQLVADFPQGSRLFRPHLDGG